METDFFNWLKPRVAAHPQMELGIGDDAAVLQLAANRRCVVTSDMLSDGVDFELERCNHQLVGRKSLAVNLSDLAAMAARPLAAIVSITLPDGGEHSIIQPLQLAKDLYEGILPLADEFDVALAGGDTNTWNPRCRNELLRVGTANSGLVISITAIGETTEHGTLQRDGAQPGDWILVTGEFGGSILGKHFDFTPRVRESLLLNERYSLHAGTDVSDGLSLDLSNIAIASNCRAVLDLERVPVSKSASELSEQTGRSALEHALSDGEDFELILAVSPEEGEKILADQPLEIPLTKVGHFVEQPADARIVDGDRPTTQAAHPLWTTEQDGSMTPLEPRGYRH